MKILCVDDHPIALKGLIKDVCDIMPEAEVYNFGKPAKALEFARGHGCDVLLCEIEMYNGSGLLLAQEIRKLYPRANIIFVTVCSENEYAAAVLRLHPSGYLTKPATKEQLKKELNDLRYAVPDMDLPGNAVFG